MMAMIVLSSPATSVTLDPIIPKSIDPIIPMHLLNIFSSHATLTGAEEMKTGPSCFRPDFQRDGR
jgi:hypothetical protein